MKESWRFFKIFIKTEAIYRKVVLGITPSTNFVYSLKNVPMHILFIFLLTNKTFKNIIVLTQ